MYDVLVIGGGMAGSIAALAAVEMGAKVAIAQRSWGATALSNGALNIAVAPWLRCAAGGPYTLQQHIDQIMLLQPQHPYRMVGDSQRQTGLFAGYELFSKALSLAGLALPALDLQANWLLLPTACGTLWPVPMALASHAAGALPQQQHTHVGVLQLAGDSWFTADAVIAGVLHDAAQWSVVAPRYKVIHAYVPFFHKPLTPTAMARVFDDPAQVLALANSIDAACQDVHSLLVPPILGLQQHAQAQANLSAALGIPVAEVLGAQAPIAGMRLQQALEQARAKAGIQSVGAVHAPHIHNGQIEYVHSQAQKNLCAKAYVLATGRYTAGGLQDKPVHSESLFQLPLLAGSQVDIAIAGIAVNHQLQPLQHGEVAFKNLFAAGMVMGGFSPDRLCCADGVAWMTGYFAGQQAASLALKGAIC